MREKMKKGKEGGWEGGRKEEERKIRISVISTLGSVSLLISPTSLY